MKAALFLVIALILGTVAYFGIKNFSPTNLSFQPASDNSLTVEKISVGKQVIVDEVNLAQPVYIVVFRDKQRIGKSNLLTIGTHTNVAVSLNATVSLGQKVDVMLESTVGALITDDFVRPISVTKTVIH